MHHHGITGFLGSEYTAVLLAALAFISHSTYFLNENGNYSRKNNHTTLKSLSPQSNWAAMRKLLSHIVLQKFQPCLAGLPSSTKGPRFS